MMGKFLAGGLGVGLTLLVLGLATQVHGAAPPPAIGNLDGTTWSVSAKGAQYDLSGGKGKYELTLDWTLTQTGPSTVSFGSQFPGMPNTAWYVDGFLLGAFDSGETPPEDGGMLQFAVSGKPGKLKLKGMLIAFSAGPGSSNRGRSKLLPTSSSPTSSGPRGRTG